MLALQLLFSFIMYYKGSTLTQWTAADIPCLLCATEGVGGASGQARQGQLSDTSWPFAVCTLPPPFLEHAQPIAAVSPPLPLYLKIPVLSRKKEQIAHKLCTFENTTVVQLK